MKLARPDVFHPRIVFAGCPRQATGDGDDAGLVAALRKRGLHARWLSWDDPESSRAHLVILRATHDYADRLDEFLTWAEGVPNLLNTPAVIAWNADRRCLEDLAHQGVPTVPGKAIAPGEAVRLPRTGGVIVGPAVGGDAHFFGDHSSAAVRVAEVHAAGHSAFVQPCGSACESTDTELIFLGGRPSHAFPPEPDFEIWEVGSAALAAAGAHLGIAPTELLYARAYVVDDPPRLRELQLIDPSLGWLRLDAAARDLAQREFAVCVESALERLGLGPLSHPGSQRRP